MNRLIKFRGKRVDLNDELLEEAEQLFKDMGIKSINLLQRRFKIGYYRAKKIVEIINNKDKTWVTGGIFKDWDGKFYIIYNMVGKNDLEYFEIIPETVGQYTGKLDKDKKEIYDGDIFEIMNSHEERFKVWVEYSEKYAQFIMRCNECFYLDAESLADIDDYTIEIIGNIHDNPELLEV